MRKLIVVLTLFVLLVGCGPRNQDVLDLPSGLQKGRMRMTSIQVFEDSRRYYRNVIVLEDTETGREYLAVMGAGVTEMTVYGEMYAGP